MTLHVDSSTCCAAGRMVAALDADCHHIMAWAALLTEATV